MSNNPGERRPAYVSVSELDNEVQMDVDKKIDPSDEDSSPVGRPEQDFVNEPYHPPQPAPFVPYCKKNMTSQTSWPFYLQRHALREYFAEFLGTWLLLTFGLGVCATKVFNAEEYDIQRDSTGKVTSYSYISHDATQSNATYLVVVIGWGMGLAMALYVTGRISGGHFNPAVTLTSAVFGTMPWFKVPFYAISQLFGAMVGAACVYGLFRPFFDMRREILQLDRDWKGSTVTDTDALGGLFCTYPTKPFYGNVFCFWSELMNTMIMMFVICGIVDEEQIPMRKNANARQRTALKLKLYQQKKDAARRNRGASGEHAGDLNESDFNLIEEVLMTETTSGGNFFMSAKPIAVGLLIFEIGVATGWCSGYALNPARDLGPRMVSAMIFRSSDPFTRNAHYFWIPMFVPFLGALLGQLLYSLFICPEIVPAMPVPDTYEEKKLLLAHQPAENPREE